MSLPKNLRSRTLLESVSYSCSPNESIVHSNAKALVDLGLADLGCRYGTITWELDPEKFELQSPKWSAYIELACNRAARELGVDAPVSAELYKTLLSKKSAMFKAPTE